MATNTVPIEIVLQDPNNPIVPDTPGDNPGENTNISVPDTALGTGYTTKDGSSAGNIFTGSNATVSIASIVVLVLALGAIVALLISKYQKRKKGVTAYASKKEKLVATATGTLAVLAATVLVGQVCMTATNAATSEGGTTLTTPDKIQIIANRYDDVTIVASTKAVSYATTDTTFGYKIFMSMAGDNANLYLGGDTTSQYYFAPTTRAGLDINSWGYNYDGEADYTAMPLVDDPIMAQQNINAVEGEEFTVYYTMKADKDMPFGIYSGEISYDIEGYSGFPDTLTTMQGMTSDICAKVYTPGPYTDEVVPTATLTDTRDNKTYEVAKLADGKCWMIQNLDLDLDSQTALTPEKTNISANWTPANSTIAFEGTSVSGWQNDYNVPYSADPGDVYYYSSGTTNNDEQYASLEACQEAHPDCSAKNHAGNYYNWSAAVASNDTSSLTEQFGNADTSICPAGWRLPTNATNADDPIANNEQDAWVSTYEGIVQDPSSCGGTCRYRNYQTGGFNKIRTNPLWLVRSGSVDNGSLSYTGNYGYYWSSTVDSSGSAYRLYFGSGNVYPTRVGGRSVGYSIRCVAQ